MFNNGTVTIDSLTGNFYYVRQQGSARAAAACYFMHGAFG